ncbi:MAG: class I SAM-dependent methyltransferase [Acidobacteriota bacterium]|nr:class I SAM-dependent methyltransferase [Acidobacteriota bacterium]
MPELYAVYVYPRRGLKYLVSQFKSNRSVFEEIYERKLWGEPESVSGRGSSTRYTQSVREQLPELLRRLEIETFFDAPCGDFFWMRKVRESYSSFRYIGCDIVPALVEENQRRFGNASTEFRVLDITREKPPRVDLILCRECLGHLAHRDAVAAVRNFRASQSRYLLATTHPKLAKNRPIITGDWGPVNLQAAPFNLPAPIEIIQEWDNDETAAGATCLGLWDLARISGDG